MATRNRHPAAEEIPTPRTVSVISRPRHPPRFITGTRPLTNRHRTHYSLAYHALTHCKKTSFPRPFGARDIGHLSGARTSSITLASSHSPSRCRHPRTAMLSVRNSLGHASHSESSACSLRKKIQHQRAGLTPDGRREHYSCCYPNGYLKYDINAHASSSQIWRAPQRESLMRLHPSLWKRNDDAKSRI